MTRFKSLSDLPERYREQIEAEVRRPLEVAERDSGPLPLAQHMSEKDWQQAVIDYARLRGYLVYHTHDSRRSEPGFPDLICLRAGRLVVMELKSAGGR